MIQQRSRFRQRVAQTGYGGAYIRPVLHEGRIDMGERIVRLRRNFLNVVEQRSEFGRQILNVAESGRDLGLSVVQQLIYPIERLR